MSTHETPASLAASSPADAASAQAFLTCVQCESMRSRCSVPRRQVSAFLGKHGLTDNCKEHPRCHPGLLAGDQDLAVRKIALHSPPASPSWRWPDQSSLARAPPSSYWSPAAIWRPWSPRPCCSHYRLTCRPGFQITNMRGLQYHDSSTSMAGKGYSPLLSQLNVRRNAVVLIHTAIGLLLQLNHRS